MVLSEASSLSLSSSFRGAVHCCCIGRKYRSPLPGPASLFPMRFLTGDQLGNIKSVIYIPSTTAQSKVTVSTLYDGSEKGKERAVQKLTIQTSADGPLVRQSPRGCSCMCIDSEVKIAVARSDGSASISRLQAQGLESLREWTEPRLKTSQRYVGLAASDAYVNFPFHHAKNKNRDNSKT